MTLEELLISLSLEQYLKVFEEDGIDDIETLQEYSDDELIELKVKKGHIKKIKKALAEDNNTSNDKKTKEWYLILSEENSLWSNELLNSDIAIISHEYNRIKELLTSGQYFGVLLQIKDFFEILLKLPVLIIANEKFNDSDRSNDKEVNLIMSALEKPLSLGHWHELATYIKKNLLTGYSSMNSLVNNTVKLYNKHDLIKWRNDEIGHGALSLDDDHEFQDDIKEKLNILNSFIKQNIDFIKEINFDKEKAIVSFGDNSSPGFPFFKIIDKKIYLFDSYLSRKKKTHQLNYCFGKKIVTETPYFEQFIAQTKIDERDNILSGNDIEDIRLADEEKQLDLLEVSTEFIKPAHLIDWMKSSLNTFSKGRLLLQMQRGTGKSLFCKALDQLSLNKVELEDDMLVRAYYINDVFRNSLSDFTSEISFFIINKKVTSGNFVDVFKGNLPNLSVDSTKSDFAYLLNWYKQKYNVDKLLLIIDGVDEIPQKDEKSIFDIIPDEYELDDGIYLLITSRTDEEITRYTKEQLSKVSFEDKRVIQKDSQENIETLKNYIGKYKLANNDIQIEDLIQKADYRILYLNMLKELLLTCNVDLDDIPSNEQIIDFYLEEVKKKYGEKYFQTIFNILIILASQLEELTIKEIAYLNSDSSVSLKLIANLFDLRGFIKKTRSENGNKFSLNHISLTHYLNKKFESEIINYLKKIYQDIHSFRSDDEADIYKMAYLEQYENQYNITLSPDLKSNKLLSFILDIKECEEHKKLKIGILFIDSLLKEDNITNFIKSLSQLDNKLLESTIYIKIKDAKFTDFIIKNIDVIVKCYQESEYNVIKSLYMNFYKYNDKNIGFKLINILLKQHNKFEDILNYISMCKGHAQPIEARNAINKYLDKNDFNNRELAHFYYIVGRIYVDDVNEYVTSKNYLEKSIDLFQRINDDKKVNIVKNTLSMYYFSNREYEKAYQLLEPFYLEIINNTDSEYDNNTIEAVYSNMFIYNLILNNTLIAQKINFLNKEIEAYNLNYRALYEIKKSNMNNAKEFFTKAIDLSTMHNNIFAVAVSSYNKSLLFDDSTNSLYNISMNIAKEKNYSAGLMIMSNSIGNVDIPRAYNINNNNYWICLKNIDMLL